MKKVFIANLYKTSTRQTYFIFEIIQRMGAKGFGAGNFKALFESIESRHYEEHYKTLIFLHYVKI
jgi:4-hydroxyphenylpyruvate dioxygenase-like putative hemolysin